MAHLLALLILLQGWEYAFPALQEPSPMGHGMEQILSRGDYGRAVDLMALKPKSAISSPTLLAALLFATGEFAAMCTVVRFLVGPTPKRSGHQARGTGCPYPMVVAGRCIRTTMGPPPSETAPLVLHTALTEMLEEGSVAPLRRLIAEHPLWRPVIEAFLEWYSVNHDLCGDAFGFPAGPSRPASGRR